MAVTFAITPVYEGEASLRVQSDRADSMMGRLGGMMGDVDDAIPMGLGLPSLGGESDVQTQIGILGSRRILEWVADSLALHVSLARPWREFRSDVLHVLEAGPEAPRGTYVLRRQRDGTYRASAWLTPESVELPKSVRIGEPFRIGPMALVLEPALADDPPRTVWFQVQPFRRMVRKLRREVRIQREDSGSRLVEIRYRHPDPALARAFVNGVVDRFMEYSEEFNKMDSGREVEILTDQLARYTAELAAAEDRLQAFQESRRIIHPEEQAIAQVERIAEVMVARDAMHVEREALAALLGDVDTRAARASASSSESPYRHLATFPSFITNDAVQELLRNLTALENTRSELLVRRTEENIDVRMVQARVREVEEQIHTMATDYLGSLEIQLASANAALDRFGIEVEAMPAVEIEYARRHRDRRLLSEIYLHLQARLTEARIQETIDDARVRVVDLGVIEDRPAFPRPAISMALALVLGLMVGLFGVVATEATSPYTRTRDEAADAADAAVLAVIPRIEEGRFGLGGRKGRRPLGVVARDDPWHPASEAFRALALSLLAGDPPPRVLLVASARQGEGRTTVAANLAAAFAQQGMNTALLDADLRAGSLHTLFGLPRRPGWVASAIIGGPDGDGSQKVEVGGAGGSVTVFPAGEAGTHPLEILASPRLKGFLTRLRDGYDVLVVDVPSLEAGHDAAVLAPLADAVLLVALQDRTRKDALAEAANRIRRADGPVAGVVLRSEA